MPVLSLLAQHVMLCHSHHERSPASTETCTRRNSPVLQQGFSGVLIIAPDIFLFAIYNETSIGSQAIRVQVVVNDRPNESGVHQQVTVHEAAKL